MVRQPVLGPPLLGPEEEGVDGDPLDPPVVAGGRVEPPSGTTVVELGEPEPVAVVGSVEDPVAL
jgi:hypothetical protein